MQLNIFFENNPNKVEKRNEMKRTSLKTAKQKSKADIIVTEIKNIAQIWEQS